MCQYPTKDELTLWGKAFERSDPKDVIAWSLAIYGPYLTLGTGFGASGMVLLDLVMRAHRAVDVFFLDTRLLFPDTYALRAGRWAGHAHKTERGLHWENGRVTRAATAAQAAPVGPAAYTQHPGHVRARASGYRSCSGRVFSGADPGRRAGRDRPSPAADHPRAGRNMTKPAGRGGERTSSHV